MQVATPQRKPIFDKSAVIAYGGAFVAVAFIAALTIGMIDAPSQRDRMAASNADSATKVVSVATGKQAATDIR